MLEEVIDVNGAMVPNERRHDRHVAIILPVPPGSVCDTRLN
jgi:hypothetical protein